MGFLAFHGDPKIKAKFVDRAKRHRKADRIIKDWYWAKVLGDVRMGCCVGCLAEDDDNPHYSLEKYAGLPAALNWIADAIFEGLPEPLHLDWVERYINAAKPGADLQAVASQFVAWASEADELLNSGIKKLADEYGDCWEYNEAWGVLLNAIEAGLVNPEDAADKLIELMAAVEPVGQPSARKDGQ